MTLRTIEHAIWTYRFCASRALASADAGTLPDIANALAWERQRIAAARSIEDLASAGLTPSDIALFNAWLEEDA